MGFCLKSGTPLKEDELTKRAVPRHQNERVHSHVCEAGKQSAQFTFAQNMNEFMKVNERVSLSGTDGRKVHSNCSSTLFFFFYCLH